MKKTNISALLLTLIGAIYLFVSLIAGMITDFSDDFLTGLLFFTLNTGIAFAVALIFAGKKTTVRDVFFRAPIYYIGTVYFAVSGILSAAHMLLGLLSVKWMIVAQLLILAVFAVYVIVSLAVKGNAENVTGQVAEKNCFLREMSSSVNVMAAACADREMQKKLEHLAEEFQYSKPAAGEALLEPERLIRQQVAVLGRQLQSGDLSAAYETVTAVNNMLMSRNKMI